MHYIDSIRVENDAIVSNFILPATSYTKTLNGTLALTNASNSAILFSGNVTGYSVNMPDATTLPQGHKYELYNSSTTTMVVKYFDGTTLFTLSQNSTGYLYLENNSTQNGVWQVWQVFNNPDVASGILNYNVVSSVLFSTTSATDVIITGFSVVPQAGTYAIWFNSTSDCGNGNANNFYTIYNGASPITNSLRSIRPGTSNVAYVASTMTIAQFNGVNACSVYVRTSASTLNVRDRSLILIRLGN